LQQLAALLPGKYRATAVLEWVICCDGGPGGSVDQHAVRHASGGLGVDVHVVATGRQAGPGPARNQALAWIRAPYLLTLDSDDLINPAGMLALLHALLADPGAGWAAGRCFHVSADLQPIWEGPVDPWPAGRVRCGAFWQHKRQHGGLPFLCPAALARTRMVRECGGWPGDCRIRAEDTALWAVLTSRWPGVWVAEHVYTYRRHLASVTHTPGFRASDEGLEQIESMVRAGFTNP
jgi:glycosyltransferase involved in cell wall biosynthesis